MLRLVVVVLLAANLVLAVLLLNRPAAETRPAPASRVLPAATVGSLHKLDEPRARRLAAGDCDLYGPFESAHDATTRARGAAGNGLAVRYLELPARDGSSVDRLRFGPASAADLAQARASLARAGVSVFLEATEAADGATPTVTMRTGALPEGRTEELLDLLAQLELPATVEQAPATGDFVLVSSGDRSHIAGFGWGAVAGLRPVDCATYRGQGSVF